MTKKFQVSWAAAAQNDLKQIIDYIAIDNPGNALKILKKIKQKVSGLYAIPRRLQNPVYRLAGITREMMEHEDLESLPVAGLTNLKDRISSMSRSEIPESVSRISYRPPPDTAPRRKR